MCQYNYIYSSTCGHADFYRTSYCDRAAAIGLPRHDGHSPHGDSANNKPDNLPGPSSSQPPASSAPRNSSSHSHSQQHPQNMSTLARSGPGAPFAKHDHSPRHHEHLQQIAISIPRSAFDHDGDVDRELDDIHVGAAMNSQVSYHGADIASDAQSSSPLDSKHLRFAARNMSFGGDGQSDTAEESFECHMDTSHGKADRSTASHTDTAQTPCSPRKPIPSQWLPTNSGPKLATAQRAKERGHKRGSVGGSPVEIKTLRGTRSSVDLANRHGSEAPTFLTKETLAAVDTDITSPTNGNSPTKRMSTRPAWQSPKSSDLRKSPRQRSSIDVKTSPNRVALLTPEVAAISHRRGPSSVATSTDGTVYHSAAGSPIKGTTGLVSPVRSSADSDLSYKTSVEILDDETTHIPYLRLNADSEGEQSARVSRASSVKAATVGRERSSRPKLKVDTAFVSTRSHAGDQSSASVTSSSAASNSPWSPASTSRIPRAAGGGAASTAFGPTRSSTLKKTQSLKTLTSPNLHESQATLPQATSAVPTRHVRTVDSSGSTPILSRLSTAGSVDATTSTLVQHTDKSSAERVPNMADQVASLLRRSSMDVHHKSLLHGPENYHVQGSRASSMSTVKATPAIQDPAIIDSAIIYSKKSGIFGTFRSDTWHPHIASRTPSSATVAPRDLSPTSGRSEQYVPTGHRQAESVHSLPSSLGSDLRATAPEFVPHVPAESDTGPLKASSAATVDPAADLLGAQAFELDMYGIPWFYYMNQVQFAYQQGFHNGRARSPKKFRARKNRLSVSSPAGPHLSDQGHATGAPPGPSEPRLSEMPPPASTVPLAEQRSRQQRDSSATGRRTPSASNTSENGSNQEQSYSPFSAQKREIDEQQALRNTTNTPRGPALDLTSIRNVAPLHTSGNLQAYGGYKNTLPNRNNFNARRFFNRSDNGLYSYGGRGTVGVPMQNIAFPDPIPPQGRPAGPHGTLQLGNAPAPNAPMLGYRQIRGSEACGTVDIIIAAERGGGQACNACVPDHPLL
ncbi:hypothetical protein FB567DRAFT_239426 [Paraphoma chrysanthemicola]|uniref:Uncharacterized protein n=1 Tax=Paraphoma chrysanthemicola TaxID=798071 RepID=A0A8K0RG12_9PLEO|nr:hypothetical protein FB567DRAFT_239426 [Paraphoma chrysanthemicola]